MMEISGREGSGGDASGSSEMSNCVMVGGRAIQLDKDGNLLHLADWTEEVATALAAEANLTLGAEHWEILNLIRQFHQRRGIAPVMRILVKLVENEFGPDKGNSLYLLKLFPGSPARVASRIAGLPRPANCI